MVVFQNIKNGSAIWSSSSTPKYPLQRYKNTNPKRCIYFCFHCRSIQDSQLNGNKLSTQGHKSDLRELVYICICSGLVLNYIEMNSWHLWQFEWNWRGNAMLNKSEKKDTYGMVSLTCGTLKTKQRACQREPEH